MANPRSLVYALYTHWDTVEPLVRLSREFAVLTSDQVLNGIAKVSGQRDAETQGAVLRAWFNDRVLPAFADRVLPFDLAAARALATFRVPEHAPLDEALIAAVAQANGLVLATRNTRHFEPLGVQLLNPWD